MFMNFIMIWTPKCFFLYDYKWQKVTVSITMSVCLRGKIGLPLDGFSWYLIFQYFSKSPSWKFKIH